MRSQFSLALAAACLALAPSATPVPNRADAAIGSPAPALDSIKWYNAPTLSMEAFRGKAVLVEVFRTW